MRDTTWRSRQPGRGLKLSSFLSWILSIYRLSAWVMRLPRDFQSLAMTGVEMTLPCDFILAPLRHREERQLCCDLVPRALRHREEFAPCAIRRGDLVNVAGCFAPPCVEQKKAQLKAGLLIFLTSSIHSCDQMSNLNQRLSIQGNHIAS